MVSNIKVLSSSAGDVIISGYLLKSRRTELFRKLLWNLDCVKHSSEFNIRDWKKRYCILYKVRRENKTEIFFDYYKDESFSKFKGRVDLEHCECIVENVNIGGQPCAFSLTTLFNGHKRIYYFIAADNKIMSDWVQQLARVAELVDFSAMNADVNPSQPVGNSCAGVNISNNSCTSGTVPPLFQRPVKTSIDNSMNPNPIDGIKSPANSPNNHVDDNEDDYKDIVGGIDYLMSGSELLDDYHHLPSSSHSYVNLINEDPDGEKLPLNTNYSSLPRLKEVHDAHMKSSNGEIYVNGDGATSDDDNKNKTPTGDGSSRKNSLKRQNSSNSVYYNVWESEDGSKVSQNPVTTNTDVNLKRNNEISTNTRIYRRSRALPGNILTSDQGLPMATTVTATTTSTSATPTAAKTLPPAAVNRKPAPPPRMISLKSSTINIPTSLTNSTYNTNVLSELSPELPLPIRVKRSQMSLDSTSSSSSSCCSGGGVGDNDETTTSLENVTIDENNNLSSFREENKENRIYTIENNHHYHRDNDDTGKVSTDYHRSTGGVGVANPSPAVGTMPVTTPTTNTTTSATTVSGKLQSNPGIGKSSGSVQKISQLNYIEPFNLDLRTSQPTVERVNSPITTSSSSLSPPSSETITTISSTPATGTPMTTTGSTTSVSAAIKTIRLIKKPSITSTTSTVLSSTSSSTSSSATTNPVEPPPSSHHHHQSSVISRLQHLINTASTTPKCPPPPPPPTATSTTTSTILPQCDYSPLPHTTNTFSNSSSINHTAAAATTTTNAGEDDEHIEYREIDPISTNALAIVTERFG